MFLVAGTFFPISNLPHGLRTIAHFNPLYHCVSLVRDVSLQTFGSVDLIHLAVLIGFGVVVWRLAIWRMHGRLID